jgi:peptide subunit release factor 1 (eRF1)
MVFTLRPSAHLPCLATRAGLGTISLDSGIVRFVQGGVVKTFRCATYRDGYYPLDTRLRRCDTRFDLHVRELLHRDPSRLAFHR